MAAVWYSVGQISVAANATVANGTNTLWLSNVRVGDGFVVAGQSQLFQITNIASDTQITFTPAFSATAVNGVGYAVVPVQGYQKDLADQVKLLLNQYGQIATSPTLAAFSAVTGGTNLLAYFTSATAMTTTAFSPFARTILDDIDASSVRTTIGAASQVDLNTKASTTDLNTAIATVNTAIATKASKGVNSDITSLTALNTPLAIPAPTTSGQAAQIDQVKGRNLLINPLFTVNQRVYSSGAATTVANQYTYDRWKVVTSGQNISLSGVVATFPAGGGAQVVEGSNIITGTYVLSWTGTGTAAINGTAITNGAPFALTRGTNATVTFVGQISFPQLELGIVKTSFDNKSYPEELYNCQYYCWQQTAVNNTEVSGLVGWCFSTTTAHVDMRLPRRMRITPAITANALALDPSTGAAPIALNSLSSVGTSPETIGLNVGIASAVLVQGRATTCWLTTAGSSFLRADAEL